MYRSHVCEAKDEANGVQDVGFARSVEASNGIERRVPSGDLRPYRIRLEAWKTHKSVLSKKGGSYPPRRVLQSSWWVRDKSRRDALT